MIITDAKGRPFQKPSREDYASVTEYLRACWAYRDAITTCANSSFDKAFREALRG